MEELGAGAPRGPGAGRGRREGRGQGGEDKRPLRGWRIWLYLQPRPSFYFFIFYGGLVSFPRLSCAVFKTMPGRPRFGREGKWVGLVDLPPKEQVRPIWDIKQPRRRGEGQEAPYFLPWGKDEQEGKKLRGLHKSTSWGWGTAYLNSCR